VCDSNTGSETRAQSVLSVFLASCARQLDVNEAPELRSPPYFSFPENLPIGSSVYNATLFDVDAGDTVSASIVGGNSNNGFPAFSVDAVGHVVTASLHDYESGQRTYLLRLALTDVGPAGPAPLVRLTPALAARIAMPPPPTHTHSPMAPVSRLARILTP
jgi:hypothetical protein